MSNYYAFLLYRRRDYKRPGKDGAVRLPGVTAYMSLLAPVAVFGRTVSKLYDNTWTRPQHHLELSEVLDPTTAEGDLETLLMAAVASTPYTFLSPEDVSQPLPEGVTPYEYCYCAEPWDKIFHILFSDTD